MLLNHTNVKRLQEKPVVLQWLCDPYDPCDPQKTKVEAEDTENIRESNVITSDISGIGEITNEKDWSPRAHRAHRAHRECYYCPEGFDFESDYKKHVLNKHPKKLCFPDKFYIEKHGLTPQGRDWER